MIRCPHCKKYFSPNAQHACTKVGRVSIVHEEDQRETGITEDREPIGISQGLDLAFWQNDTPTQDNSTSYDSGGFGGDSGGDSGGFGGGDSGGGGSTDSW